MHICINRIYYTNGCCTLQRKLWQRLHIVFVYPIGIGFGAFSIWILNSVFRYFHALSVSVPLSRTLHANFGLSICSTRYSILFMWHLAFTEFIAFYTSPKSASCTSIARSLSLSFIPEDFNSLDAMHFGSVCLCSIGRACNSAIFHIRYKYDMHP